MKRDVVCNIHHAPGSSYGSEALIILSTNHHINIPIPSIGHTTLKTGIVKVLIIKAKTYTTIKTQRYGSGQSLIPYWR